MKQEVSLSDFQELELLPAKELQNSVYIKHSVSLEQVKTKCENNLLVALNLWSNLSSSSHWGNAKITNSSCRPTHPNPNLTFFQVSSRKTNTCCVCSSNDKPLNLACEQAYLHSMHKYKKLWSLHKLNIVHFSTLVMFNLHTLST